MAKLILAAAISILITLSSSAQEKIYYTFNDGFNNIYNVSKANIDGSSPQIIVPDDGVMAISGIALDLTNSKVYFTDIGSKKIRKCNFDGTSLQDVMTNVWAIDIALDLTGGKMYYTLANSVSTIYNVSRANLNGTSPEIIVPDNGTIAPNGIALDLINGKVYYSDIGGDKIARCNLDGSSPQDLITSVNAIDLALDVNGGKVYYTIANTVTTTFNVSRANLNGTSQEIIIPDDGFMDPKGIALDLTNSKIYYIDTGNHKIRKCNLNGSSIQDIITGVNPTSIVGTITSPPLPVELTSFSAVIINGKTKLNWATATEINNFGFEIQRSRKLENGNINENEWEKAGFIKGTGNSNSVKQYSFVDDKTIQDDVYYRLKQIDNDGSVTFSKEILVNAAAPLQFSLEQNYPNPFNPVTSIGFTIPESGDVSLKIYNSIGEEVADLVNNFLEAGIHSVDFKASGLSSGVYIYTLEVKGKYKEEKKMSLLK